MHETLDRSSWTKCDVADNNKKHCCAPTMKNKSLFWENIIFIMENFTWIVLIFLFLTLKC